MKTVWIYVDTSEQVGDVDHLKVFSNQETLPMSGWRRTILKVSLLNTMS